MELNESNLQRRAIFSQATLQEVMNPKRLQRLKAIAIEQQNLLAA